MTIGAIISLIIPLLTAVLPIIQQAIQNSTASQAEALSALRVALAQALSAVDASLAELDKARADADATIAAGQPPA